MNCFYCHEKLEENIVDFCSEQCENRWVASADAYWEEVWEISHIAENITNPRDW